MPKIKDLNVNQVNELILENKAFIIDVREEDEFKESRIKNAINIPLGNIEAKDLEPFYNNGDKKIILHCLAGKRSQLACEKIISSCKNDIYNMAGGIKSWEDAGLPL